MKIDLRNNTTLLLAEAVRLIGLAPVFAMMSAVVMLVLAVFSVDDMLRVTKSEKIGSTLPEFTLRKLPVTASVYEEYARVLGRLSPDVQVRSDSEGIRIEIADANKYAEFMYVLNSVQGLSKGVVWQASEICLAGCSGGASSAIVKGMTETIEVKLRGNINE